MGLLMFIIVVISILLTLVYVLHEIGLGKYKLNKEAGISELEINSINKFTAEYPEKSIEDLKIEIEKITDMLLDNEESNRYTYRVQEKARKDSKLNKVRNSIADSVDIVKYNNGELQAQVNYLLDEKEFTIIMYMNVVRKGRAFLKNYKTMEKAI